MIAASMNPFDLPGPQFLVFFLILAGALIGLLWIFRHSGESNKPAPSPELTDPYLVAYLRAGPTEVWRLATVRLIDRGLLQVHGETVSMVDDAPQDVQNEVERATLEWFRIPRTATSLVKKHNTAPFVDLVAPYEKRLMELELWRSRNARTASATWHLMAAGVLGLVAVTKILIALDRGHKNIGFLIVLVLVGLFTVYNVARPDRTRRGNAVLEDLKKLFSRLHQPGLLQPGKSSPEVMWMAAVYGMGALTFSHIERLYPKAQAGGSSCGSSCGGGGCGGGCGGCGG